MTTRSRSPLPSRASVVVIGGGVIGTSAAFHLAEAGVEVLLLERGDLGSGSTSKAAGGVRAQFSDPLNIEIAQRSLRAFRDFANRPGWDIDLKQVGYLIALTTAAEVESFERSVALQNEHGVPSRIISAEDARRLSPLLAVDDVLAAAFSPEDGHATPDSVVQGYAGGARALGADLRVGCEVLDIQISGRGEISAVVTDQGSVETETVICAAGPWARACGAMVGVDIPVTPFRRQVLFTDRIDDLPSRTPMTIDFESGFYFHREGPGLLLGMSDPTQGPGFGTEKSDHWIPELSKVIARRAPRIAEAGIRGGWAGLYEMSPDHNAMIGEASEPSRFLYAAGFSGHGFLQGPAVGEILRDLVLGRPPPVDIGPLSLERFGSRDLRPERNVI